MHVLTQEMAQPQNGSDHKMDLCLLAQTTRSLAISKFSGLVYRSAAALAAAKLALAPTLRPPPMKLEVPYYLSELRRNTICQI